MRRIFLAVSVVASVLVTSTSIHAATLRPQSQHLSGGLAGLYKTVRPLGHVHAPALAHRSRELRQMGVEQSTAGAPPQQTPASMALPASAFSPATINTQYTGTTDAANADGDWFRSNHSQGSGGNYESFGMIAGYYQRADWNVTNPPISFRYQGMYGNSVAGAVAGYNDAVSYSGQGNSPQSCTKDPSTLNCSQMVYSYTSSGVNYTEEYLVFQYRACLGEITGTVPTANLSAYASQIDSTIGNIFNAAVTVASNVCGNTPPPANPTATPVRSVPTPLPTQAPAQQTDFSVVSVRFEKAGADADWNLTNAPVTQVKAGSKTKVQISIYVNVRSLSSVPATVNRAYVLKLNGKTIFNKTTSSTITDPDTYRWSFDNVQLKKAGTYTFAAAVQIGNKTDGDSSTLKAAKKYTAPKKVSFTLNNVSLLNDSNAPQTRFHPGDGFYVQIDYTVKNAKQSVPVTVQIVFVSPSTGKWLSKPFIAQDSTKSVNNKKQAFHFLTPQSFGSQVKMQVGLTVGSGTQTGSTMLNVG